MDEIARLKIKLLNKNLNLNERQLIYKKLGSLLYSNRNYRESLHYYIEEIN